jgi:hypothetical protein
MRRQVGIRGLTRQQEEKEAFQKVGDELAAQQLEQVNMKR